MSLSHDDTFVIRKNFLRGKFFSIKAEDGHLRFSRSITDPGEIYLVVPYILALSGDAGSFKVDVLFPGGSFSGSFELEGASFTLRGVYTLRCGFSEEGKVRFRGRVEKRKEMVKFKYDGVIDKKVRLETGWPFLFRVLYKTVEGSLVW